MNRNFEEMINTEGIVKNEPATYMLSEDTAQHGKLILTTKRLFFVRDVAGEHEEAPDLEIDLDTINAVAQETYIVDNNILSITYLQYETAKFSVLNYEEWETAIEETRMTPDIPGDPNKAPELTGE